MNIKRFSFDEVVDMCLQQIPNVKQHIIGVCRGGLIPAVIIARQMKKPLLVYTPRADNNHLSNLSGVTFIEEIVAKGRTVNDIIKFCESNNITDYNIISLVIDKDAPHYDCLIGNRLEEWVEYPWELESTFGLRHLAHEKVYSNV